MPFEIRHNHASWQAKYQDKSVCGPSSLSINGAPLLKDVYCRLDSFLDRDMQLSKKRFFRKGGARIHYAIGLLTNGNTITQTARYSGNTCRITTDVKWHSGNLLKEQIEINSFVLTGTWKRVLTLPDFQWHDLPAIGTLEFSPFPTAMIFENADGLRIESGCGNDLWRWENGFDDGKTQPKVIVECKGKTVSVKRIVTHASAQQPLEIQPRFYRFESYFAWSAPDLVPALPKKKAVKAILGNNGIENLDEITALPEGSVISMELPEIETEGENCWEGRFIQKVFRKTVRQLAEISKKLSLRVDKGITPHYCMNGAHVFRKANTKHWDLGAILEAMTWMRQCIGEKWIVSVVQPDQWCELPSLTCLGVDNGFSESGNQSQEDE